jgi:chromate transporter
VNAASLALMLVVTIQLSKTALVDATTLILLIASLTALVAFRLNSVWLVMGGLAIGFLFH